MEAGGGNDGPETIRASLGKYRLLAELGSGGMATVFLAIMRGESGFNKLVVLKVLKPHLELDADVVAMFHEEAKLSALLNHPNVVQTYEVGKEGGHHIMVMEYLDGVALNELIDRAKERGQPLPLAMHLRIIHAALDGLHYAHELVDFDGERLGVVHRDISPHNIFITFEGQVKVLDFGIAKLASSSFETRAGTIKGKIRYMAPEQMRGERVDRRADIFAVGGMLWEAATGQRLWKGRGDVEILHQVLHEQIPSPREVAPNVSPALDRICQRALARAREERPADCVALQSEIEALLEQLGDRTTPRELGRFLSSQLSDVRDVRKKIIEAQLKNANTIGSGYLRAVTSGEVEVPTLPALPAYNANTQSLALGREISALPGGKRVLPVLLGAAAIAGAVVLMTRRPAELQQHVEPAAQPARVVTDEAPIASATTTASSPPMAPSAAPSIVEPHVPKPPNKVVAAIATSAKVEAPAPPSASVLKKPVRPIDSANPWTE